MIAAPRWSPEEDELLSRLWGAMPRPDVYPSFPIRTPAAIARRAEVLGLGRRYFAAETCHQCGGPRELIAGGPRRQCKPCHAALLAARRRALAEQERLMTVKHPVGIHVKLPGVRDRLREVLDAFFEPRTDVSLTGEFIRPNRPRSATA